MTIDAGPDELYTTLARAADVPALVALVNGAYRGESSRRGWTTEADLVGGTRIDAAALRQMLAVARPRAAGAARPVGPVRLRARRAKRAAGVATSAC